MALRTDTPRVPQGEESELEQVEHELADLNKSRSTPKEMEKLERRTNAIASLVNALFSQIFLKSFTLTFLAEWGDRSQIATIGCAMGCMHKCTCAAWGGAARHYPRMW